MKIIEEYPLSKLSSIRLGGFARYYTQVTSRVELRQAVAWARRRKLPFMSVGSGHNIIFTDEGYDGLIIANRLKGMKSLDEDGEFSRIEAAAGESWDDLVGLACRKGLTGIEAMSLIPGSVGAAPVQNIGAYGQDFAAIFGHLEALDTHSGKFVLLNQGDCCFRYRSSIFKSDHPSYQAGRFIISKVVIRLRKGQMHPPFYATLQKYLDEHQIHDYPPQVIRRAVIAWRTSYLPDPKVHPNVGSFFKNPIVSKKQLDAIIAKNPTIADWPTQWYWPNDDGTFKVAAGRLADHLGLKDWKDKSTGMGTWKNQALIFVNYKARSYHDLKLFLDQYRRRVHEAYGIELELEPEIIPAK